MDTTKYMQTDSRWGGLGYPKAPWYIRNCGCGEVSICNAIIEMQKYVNYTPATIQPYCKQFAAPNGDGTYWSGIPKMMEHYGLTEVKEHATMKPLWDELSKGDRVAIYLMGSRSAGSKGVHWTSSGHFVCSVDYKKKEGKNYVYVKDSYSNSSLRNGWITYEDNMRGAVLKVWSGKLSGKLTNGTVITDVKGTNKVASGKLSVDGVGGPATVTAMQKFFKVSTSGVITGEREKNNTMYPSLTSVKYGKGGCECIRELQKWLGLEKITGVIGSKTIKAWKKKLYNLGYLSLDPKNISPIFGVKSMKAWQECLNNNGKKKGNPKPSQTKTTYQGDYPTTAEIKTASNRGIREGILKWCKQIADSGKYGYKAWTSDAKTHQCPICHPGSGNGWNCIGYAWASWHHGGGLPSKCNCGVINDATAEKIRSLPYSEALSLAQSKIGIKDISLTRGNNGVNAKDLDAGDVILYYSGNTYTHTAVYIGDELIADDSSSQKPNIKYGSKYYRSYWKCKVGIRYTGGNDYLKKGDVGKAVKDIQKYLNWYDSKNKLSTDGVFGASTEKAVIKFQKAELGKDKGDGLVGSKTIAAMKKVKK